MERNSGRDYGPTDEEIRDISEVFNLLGDSTILKIAYSCLEGSKSVKDIACITGIKSSLISHDLHQLFLAGIMKEERRGKERYYSYGRHQCVEDTLKNSLEHLRGK